MLTWIKIEPNDTLFFRSGRPFTMGDDTWADIIFPPYPSTIFGAIRSFFIFEKGTLKDFREGRFKDDIGTPDPREKGKLKIKGPLLFNEEINTIFFKSPLDLVRLKKIEDIKKEDKYALYSLDLIDKPKIFFSEEEITDKLLIFKRLEQVEEPEGWLDRITFQEYLENKGVDEFSFIEDIEIFGNELKIGIARDRKKFTSREGYLYRIPLVRIRKGYSLLVGIEGIQIPDKGIFQLGGEGKTVSFEKLDFEETKENPIGELEDVSFELADNIFKIYLATPAIFKKGWIPEWIDEKNLEGEKNGIKLKLITCVIGKYIRIGGWDMARNQPKQMFKTIPAGSVYYFEVLNRADAQTVKDVFHFKNISDINQEEGFGLSFVGRVRI